MDTFASNLHDSWGAHGQHDSPPASESVFDNPPRLSPESVRSAASAASKASSGESILPSRVWLLTCGAPMCVGCM